MNVSALESQAVSKLVFHARRYALGDPFWIEVPSAALACLYHCVAPSLPTIVYWHGNGEVVADYCHELPRLFAEIGANTLLVEYRGYGASTGDATLVNLIGDVPYILDAIRSPTSPLVFFGRSLGGLAAIHAASLCPDATLVLEGCIANVGNYILYLRNLQESLYWPPSSDVPFDDVDVRKAANFLFDHRMKLASFMGRSLVVHAGQDYHLPLHNAQDLYSWLNEPKRLRIFHNCGHSEVFFENLPDYMVELDSIVPCSEERRAYLDSCN